jgi:hypothetical protein
MRGLVPLALLAAASPAAAQTVREFSVLRQQQGEPALAVQLDYAAGVVSLAPAPAGTLYQMVVTYDEDRFTPLAEVGADGALRLGVASLGRGGVRLASATALLQTATVRLSPTADIDLAIRLDAADATLDLGGLRLARLSLGAGTSSTTLRMEHPNAVRCSEAALEAGAGELVATGLGNARCERVTVRGGAGRVTLDFSGAWSGRMRVTAQMKVGELVLRLPRGTGARLAMDTFLASFAPTGLASTDGGKTWATPRYDQAASQLDVTIESAIGGVRVEWID